MCLFDDKADRTRLERDLWAVFTSFLLPLVVFALCFASLLCKCVNLQDLKVEKEKHAVFYVLLLALTSRPLL